MSFLLNNKEDELNNSITCIIREIDLNKLSKTELLKKCQELGFKKCKSKNKSDLIDLVKNKMMYKKRVN